MKYVKPLFTLLLIFLVLLGIKQNVHASHLRGAHFEYECLSACTSRVWLYTFEECPVNATPGPELFTWTPASTPCALPVAIDSGWVATYHEVTPVCPTAVTLCTNPSTGIPAVMERQYWRDYNVCSAGNCVFTLEWSHCCRNAALTNICSSTPSTLVLASTSFNNTLTSCNNSPVFNNDGVFQFCYNTNALLATGGFDPDGDSLSYELGPCFDSGGSPVCYTVGASAFQPLGSPWNVAINPQTGDLSIIPNPGALAFGAICVYTSEWRNGVLINTYGREIHVKIINCTGGQTFAPTQARSLSPGATISGTNIDYAGTDTLRLSFEPSYSGTGSYNMTLEHGLVGAIFSDSATGIVADTLSGTNLVGSLRWLPSQPGLHYVTVKLWDNNCPYNNASQQTFLINVSCGSVAAPSAVILGGDSIDICSGNIANVYGAGGFSNYVWNNGMNSQIASYTNPGWVWLWVEDANGCVSADSFEILSDTAAEVSGTIMTSVSGVPLANQNVILVEYDTTGGGTLTSIDTTQTDANGNYFFCGPVTGDTVYIKALPDSATYPNEMPTYYAGVLSSASATNIIPSLPITANFSTLFGSNPGGPGFIGGLISLGANKTNGPGDPVPGLTIWLLDNSTDDILGSQTTDNNGYFAFPNLPYGTYKIITDKPGISETNVPVITLSAAVSSLDSLDFRLNSTYLQLFLNTGIPSASPLDFQVFPVPSQGRIHLSIKGFATEGVCNILSATGQVVETFLVPAGNSTTQLNPARAGWKPGIYFAEIRSGDLRQIRKIVYLP